MMATLLQRYVGNLHMTGRSDLNLDALVLETGHGREYAISTLSKRALDEMERLGIAATSLAITEDGRGIGSFPLENPKHTLRL
jgi:hypothetical protein